ncbi:MAG: thiamine pyrophosphate-binding protein, partial [Chloroflexota bacterium]|nr:thiamine pyrophosphate-binding protein [Chloroflexota bacterium]
MHLTNNPARMTGAQAAVESLRREGVEYLFGVPGTTVLPIYDALWAQKAVKLIATRHEQGSAHMAEGYARAGHRPGVCMASRGPGAANMAIGLHNAYAASSPVVALVGSVSTDICQRDAFEEMDLLTFYRPITKWAVEVQRADRIPEFIQRGVRASMAGRARPVLVAVPQDLQEQEADMRFLPPAAGLQGGSEPAAEDVRRAVEVLAGAHRPIILVGGGVTWAGASELVARLAEATGIPAIATHSRKDNFPNEHPLFRGSLTGSSGAAPATVAMAKEADVVLALGCRFSEFTTRRYTLFSKSRIVHVDIDPTEIGKVYTPEVAIVADLGRT